MYFKKDFTLFVSLVGYFYYSSPPFLLIYPTKTKVISSSLGLNSNNCFMDNHFPTVKETHALFFYMFKAILNMTNRFEHGS